MKRALIRVLAFLALSVVLSGCSCNVQEVPPAHVGLEFKKSRGGPSGFSGDLKLPGTYSLDWYSTLPLLQCKEETIREPFPSLAKDGVEFGIDVYVRFSANCEEKEAAQWIFGNVQPAPGLKVREGQAVADAPKQDCSKKEGEDKAACEKEAAKKEDGDEDYGVENYGVRTITAYQLYSLYLRAIVGNAVRDSIATYASDEINSKRDEIAKAIDESIRTSLEETFKDRKVVIRVHDVSISKIDFPDKMTELNNKLANRKTEIKLEEENLRKVKAEIETEKMQKDLEKVKAEKSVQEIELIGKIIRNNPEYLEYLMVTQQPKTMEALGKGGSTFVFGTPPSFMTQPVRRREAAQ